MLLLFALAIACSRAIYAQAPEASERIKTADEIVQDVMRAADRQRTTLKPYSVTRRYTVRNRHLKRDAVLDVLWTYDPAKGKQFRIISNEGATGLTRSSLLKVLEEEAKNSRTSADPSRISPEHYRFTLAGVEQANYKLRLEPRERSKYLLYGQAQVLRCANAIVRVEGRTSKRLSFWVSEADIVQEFSNVAGFWLPFRTQSVTNIRFVGRTELVIDAGQYQFSR